MATWTKNNSTDWPIADRAWKKVMNKTPPEKVTTETNPESFIITICWTWGFELDRVKVVYQVSDHGDLWHHRSSKGDSLETHLLIPWVKTYLFKSDCLSPCSFHTSKIESFEKKKKTWKASVINWYNVWYDHFIFTSFLRFISSFAGNIMSTYLLLDPMSPRSSSRLHRWANAKWNSNASLLSLFAWHDAFLKSCLSIKSKGDLECDKHKFVAFWGMLQRDQFQRIWNINMTWLTVQKCSNISSRTTSTQKFCVAEELPGMRS